MFSAYSQTLRKLCVNGKSGVSLISPIDSEAAKEDLGPFGYFIYPLFGLLILRVHSHVIRCSRQESQVRLEPQGRESNTHMEQIRTLVGMERR